MELIHKNTLNGDGLMPIITISPTLAEVAETYQSAVSRGLPPAKSVQDRFGLPRTTATKKIKKARESGLLPDDTRPKHSRKLVDVADALGVNPDDLRDAILAHAAGDLRVLPPHARTQA